MMDKQTQSKGTDLKSGRLMGLDIGEKRIGIAISDELHFTAQPFDTLARKNLSSDLRYLQQIVDQQGIKAIVIGLPRNMNGTLGPQAQFVMEFSEKLAQTIDIPLIYWDERLSSIAADRVLLEADLSREKRKKHIDKVAATIILQGYLDSK